ncbi:Holliday junction resolvase RuvX [Kaistella sp. PBT33-4]|uniref:Holliday junction resolvase RuvX n=1 Tax=Kaistella sp. PBT33-4 TaxID=3032000 RepID=UPI0023D7F61A|nr:Holliday junction resolvase RuvX [Kaistella sp. PBT33-4]MDF0718646.1 Holliday junction resolvase RuvX [Kaistella sp. PBT33-4]
MGQIMGIDYGKKRVGVAVTDDMQIIASGLETVENARLFDFLNNYFQTYKVDAIVVGLPTNLQGEPSEVEKDILAFIKVFEAKFPGIPVNRMDERFTSKLASLYISQSGKSKKKREDKALIDKVSATIILQNYLQQIQK